MHRISNYSDTLPFYAHVNYKCLVSNIYLVKWMQSASSQVPKFNLDPFVFCSMIFSSGNVTIFPLYFAHDFVFELLAQCTMHNAYFRQMERKKARCHLLAVNFVPVIKFMCQTFLFACSLSKDAQFDGVQSGFEILDRFRPIVPWREDNFFWTWNHSLGMADVNFRKTFSITIFPFDSLFFFSEMNAIDSKFFYCRFVWHS